LPPDMFAVQSYSSPCGI